MKLKLANNLVAGIARLNPLKKFYQWVFTDKSGEIVGGEYIDYGTGGNNITIVSGTMDGHDLVIRQPAGNAGLFALSEAYNLGWYTDLNTPLDVDWDTLNSYPQTLPINIETTGNAINSIIIGTNQKLLESVPIEVSNEWYLPDETLNNNDVKIKSQVANFNNAPYCDLGVRVDTQVQDHVIRFGLYDLTSSSSKGIMNIAGRIGNQWSGITIYARVERLSVVNAVSTSVSESFVYNGDISDTDVEIILSETNITINIDGVEVLNEVKAPTVFTSSYKNYIAAVRNVTVEPTLLADYKLKYFYHDKLGNYYITEGQGSTLFCDTEANNALISDITSEFWDYKTYEKEAYPYTKGATLYTNNSNGSIMPLPFDTSQTILGFTKDLYYPIVNGILNEDSQYIWPVDFNLSQTKALQNAGIYSYEPDIDLLESLWDGATTYSITADGLGDYATIREAVLDQTGNSYIKINVQAGTYYEQDIVGVNKVWLNAVGDVTIISDGLSTDISPADYSFPTYANTAYNLIPAAYKHCFYVAKNILITGFNSTANDVKYNSHQDTGGVYESYFVDCNFIKIENNDITYESNIGIGSRSGQYQVYINCTFELQTTLTPSANSSRIFLHNDDAESNPANALFSRCTAENGNLLYILELESNQDDLVNVVDCVISDTSKGFVYASNDVGLDYNIWVNIVNTITNFIEINRPDASVLNIATDVNLLGDVSNWNDNLYLGATPRIVGFAEISNIKPDSSDFQIDNSGEIIKNMASQPFENVTYLGVAVTYLGKAVTYLKTHLIP